jgi:hypothetical protein
VSQNYSTRTLYLANYFDGEYPEDNENFAAYQTSEEAEARSRVGSSRSLCPQRDSAASEAQ